MENNKGYTFFDHTADIGISVLASDLKELFTYSAKGMFEIIGSSDDIEPHVEKEIDIEADDLSQLLHKWLSELLYLFETEKLFLIEFNIKNIGLYSLKALVRGESYMGNEEFLQREIKAVTYHGLDVKQEDDGWSAKVIFDI